MPRVMMMKKNTTPTTTKQRRLERHRADREEVEEMWEVALPKTVNYQYGQEMPNEREARLRAMMLWLDGAIDDALESGEIVKPIDPDLASLLVGMGYDEETANKEERGMLAYMLAEVRIDNVD